MVLTLGFTVLIVLVATTPDLKVAWGTGALGAALGLAGRVLLHRHFHSVRGQHIGARAWTALYLVGCLAHPNSNPNPSQNPKSNPEPYPKPDPKPEPTPNQVPRQSGWVRAARCVRLHPEALPHPLAGPRPRPGQRDARHELRAQDSAHWRRRRGRPRSMLSATCPFGRAPARPLRLLGARLVALGGVHSRGEKSGHWMPSHRLGCSS